MVAIMIIDRDHKTELNQALSSQVMDKCKQSFSPMQSQYRDYHRCIQYSVRTHIEAELKAKDWSGLVRKNVLNLERRVAVVHSKMA